MKKITKNYIVPFMVIISLLTVTSACSQTETVNTTPSLQCNVDEVNIVGNLVLDLSFEELQKNFDYGDIVTLTVNNKSYDAPVCYTYTDVPTRSTLLMPEDDGKVQALILYGDLALDSGIAQYDEASRTFQIKETIPQPVQVSITMKEKAGYKDELELLDLNGSESRSDYPNLTDEQFANFRAVGTTGIGTDKLYRSSSPIIPDKTRHTYADAAAEKAQIKSVINLVDTKEKAQSYEHFDETYVSNCNLFARNVLLDYTDPRFIADIADAYRSIISAQAPYLIHCEEGRDRTGMCVALLECLMGASTQEVISDYMVTYYNMYGVEPGTYQYDLIADSNVVYILNDVFGLTNEGKSIKDPGVKLNELAENYFTNTLKLTPQEITSIKEKLA